MNFWNITNINFLYRVTVTVLGYWGNKLVLLRSFLLSFDIRTWRYSEVLIASSVCQTWLNSPVRHENSGAVLYSVCNLSTDFVWALSALKFGQLTMLELLNIWFFNYYAYFAQKWEIFTSVVEVSCVSFSAGMFIF